MKGFDAQCLFLVPVVGLHGPSSKVEVDNLFPGEALLTKQVGEKNGERAVGGFEFDDSKFDSFVADFVFETDALLKVARGDNPDRVLLFAALDKALYGTKG